MLHRQRAVLQMIEHVATGASMTQLTKWAFLVRHWSDAGDDTFYDFFPHMYGPYSFQLAHETEKLVAKNYIRCGQGSLLSRTRDAATEIVREPVRRAVGKVMRRFGGLSGAELTDFVYAHWPWFTVNSRKEGKRRASRPRASLAVHTVGYEGTHVDAFLNGLLRSGIEGVIDVRRRPISRQYGYHKGTLRRLLESVGIRYVHFGELGIESERRASSDSGAEMRDLMAWYASERLPAHQQTIAKACDLLRERPTALLCMEADHTVCHRTPLAEHLSTKLELPVDHLCLTA